MDDEWGITWQEVASRSDQILPYPPFNAHPVDKLTCVMCGGKVRYGTRWESHGWMCSTRQCMNCSATHIITDSAKFCKACNRGDASCLSYPQIFIRKSE